MSVLGYANLEGYESGLPRIFSKISGLELVASPVSFLGIVPDCSAALLYATMTAISQQVSTAGGVQWTPALDPGGNMPQKVLCSMKQNMPPIFGEILRYYRRRIGFSQAELAVR